MKIYIVTEGQYSDYHIIGAFTDKAKAEECVDNYPESEIEEYEDGEYYKHPASWKSVSIYLDNTQEPYVHNWMLYEGDTVAYSENYKPQYIFTVNTDSVSKAKAIAIERYNAFLAIKDTHFPDIDKRIIKRHGYDYYPVYGYFDYQIKNK